MEDEPQTLPEPTQKPESPAQKRINELYGKYKQAQEQTAAFETQNAELRSQLAGLQEKVTTLEAQRQTSPVGDPFAQPAVQTGTPSASGFDVEKVANLAAERAVGALRKEFKQRDQVSQLQQAQRNSFVKASEQFPEIGDPQSELNRTAAEILNLDKYLQAHPDGPFLAAAAAKGFMSPAAAVPAPEQKLAAAQVPTGAGLPEATPKEDTPEAIEKTMDEIMAQIRAGQALDGSDRPMSDIEQRDLYFKYRQLQQKLPQSKQN